MLELRDYVYTFSKDNEPIAFASDGEEVVFHTLDCFGHQIQSESDLLDHLDYDRCNPATGPLYIDKAQPGDVLAVDILDIETAKTGVMTTIKDGGALGKTCEMRTKILKVEDGFVYFNDIRFPAEPMIGVIGCAPDGDPVISAHSFSGGGNMDSRIITRGTTVYLPVRMPGGLLAMGDVHAAMGDGEVCETGVEIDATIRVKIRLIKSFRLDWPLTETEDFWFVNTNGKDCDSAIQRGYEEMQRLIMNAYGWDATDACIYLSAQARVEANQAVLDANDCDEEGDTFRVGVPKLREKQRLIP